MKVDPEWLEATLAELVAIDSRNPTLVPGASGEREIAGRIAEILRGIGLEAEIYEAAPGRVSAVGRLRGTGGGRSLMLNGHVDTVGVDGMERPFEPRVDVGRLYGRGAYDMKGSVAAMLAAAKALVEEGAPMAGDLVVACVADEEVASLGTTDVLERYPVEGAIVTEPTGLALSLAHKGFVWLDVEVRGRAAHGSRPDLGVDANLRMGRFLARLEGLERQLRGRAPHPLVGPPSLHVGVLQGGEGPSTYAERCVARIERRTVPGETVEEVTAEVSAILDGLRSEDSEYEAEVRVDLARAPFEAREGGLVAAVVETAATEVLGAVPARRGDSYWMDAAL
ncbi:MAG TPA: M20/M25/M40 family metallo-hydrolase, partial [Gemmatimonadota bacterium]|nr:M20/M25/M40 family metallo-hydrolase [Gemmatimonadota bacterium]